MSGKRLLMLAVLVSCLIFFVVSEAVAAENSVKIIKSDGTEKAIDNDNGDEENVKETSSSSSSSGGNMKISPGKFISKSFWSDVDPLMPLAMLVGGFILFIYAVSCIVCPAMCGTKSNVGAALGDNNVRKDGNNGTIQIIIGIFLFVVGMLATVLLWNGYGPGSW